MQTENRQSQPQPYDVLAAYYDHFQETEDYAAVCEWLQQWRAGLTGQAAERIAAADLGCGTGTLSVILAQMGFPVTAVDRSAEMLRTAERKWKTAQAEKGSNGDGEILFLQQDLTRLHLPQQVGLAVCVTDTLNHLTPSELPGVLDLVFAQLTPGGILIFDLLRLDFLREERGEQTFFSELPQQDAYLVWQNRWDEAQKTAFSELSIYEEVSVFSDPSHVSEMSDPSDSGEAASLEEQAAPVGEASVPGDFRCRREQIVEYYHDTVSFAEPDAARWRCLDRFELPERVIFVWQKVK